MEFVLTIGEGMGRLDTTPSARQVAQNASLLLIPLEYETLNRILCPGCSGHAWQTTMRMSLTPREDLDWPFTCPGGDLHHCECKTCGHSIEVTFWFTK